jgi:ABC-type branched-subunit amino acid transport system ATPase component
MAILGTKNITKHFDGVYAVDNLSISFEVGKITSIIGPNGSGKTTLTNLLTGLIPFDSGEIIIADSTVISKMRPHEIPVFGLTRTFQEVRLFEQMTVLDNILLVLTERNLWASIFERHGAYHLEKAEEVLRKVNLWEKRSELAFNLSYGQRKLLEVARVLAMTYGSVGGAQIFIFDEPFAGLFSEMTKVVVGVMEELRAKGKTLILIEHNMDLIRKLSDKVFVLDAGKLLAEGEPEKVLSQREVIEAYLGE